MSNKTILLTIPLLVILSLTLTYAQEAGGGGEPAPVPSNGTAGGGGAVVKYTVPYVDPKILEEFNKTSEVKIIVEVRDTSGITVTSEDSEEQQTIKDAKKKEILQNKTNSVLSTLPEVEFKLGGKFLLGNGFYGRITKTGFDILINNSDVVGIYSDRAIHTTPAPIVIVDKNESKKEPELKVVNNDTVLKNIPVEKEQKSGAPEPQKIKEQEEKNLLSFLIIIFVIIIIISGIYLIIKFRKKVTL